MANTTYRVIQSGLGFDVEYIEPGASPRFNLDFESKAAAEAWIVDHQHMDEAGKRWERNASENRWGD
ncbi:MAG: hypothetical protein P4L71_01995 [Acetobacteraceae bacterium]|nr:hypothetical protein [Acetobacteraceae bacterium]